VSPPLSPGCPPCSKGWIYFGNSCYFYSKTASPWEGAQSFCSTLGTQLLEVDSPEEKVRGDGEGWGGHSAVPKVGSVGRG